MTALLVGEVVRLMGRGAAFLTGVPEIATTVDALASLATFSISVVKKLVEVVITAWTKRNKEMEKAQLLVALLKLVSKEMGSELIALKDNYFQFVSLMTNVISAFRKWNWSTTVKIVTYAFIQRGSVGTLEIYSLLKPFLWPTCPVSEKGQFIVKAAEIKYASFHAAN